MSRGRDGTSPAAPASLPNDDDMLREILIRLPPQPSSLPRASAVCRRWRLLVTDAKFHRQFRAHHRKPPLLGVFQDGEIFQDGDIQGIVFTPVLDSPDRVPPQRFSLGRCSSSLDYNLLDCRHGLVLVKDRVRNEVVVCDPISGKQRSMSIPLEFIRTGFLDGVVFCNSSSNLTRFKVVLVTMSDDQFLVSVYSSETAVWGNVISTAAPCSVRDDSETLVGNAVYWLLDEDGILEFNLDEQSLAVLTVPPISNDIIYVSRQIIRAEHGAVGFAILSYPGFLFLTWQRNVNGHGDPTWVPWKTIEMHTILGLPSSMEIVCLVGYDEDNGTILSYVDGSVYGVQLISMQSRKLYKTQNVRNYHAFTSFFTPETNVGGGHDTAGLLHNE